ncbi:retinol-binding protein pinta [Leptinotarsa decemlineata]|uniref:retinol-binding protein pinta n=1 Tax=Leptinotarsa decemlineata TaxID=7539 RepID=UPI000C25353A|nr:retinol-binding protein pinta-like [Leptinotarsa decemlineata]
MCSKTTYFQDVSLILEKGLKQYNKTENDLKQDIQIIKKWVESQPHLPEVPDDNMLTCFLMINQFSIENTKERIDMYYSMRSLFPDFFDNKHPLSPHMLKLMDTVYFLSLPKATEEGYRVNVFKIPQENSLYDLIDFWAHTYNIADVRFREDCMYGDIIVYDLKNTKMAHLTQATPTLIKQIATLFQKVFNTNVVQQHFINCPSFVEPLISFAVQLVNSKIDKRFHFHKDVKSLLEFIPAHVLPSDLGGTEKSLQELNEKWKKKFAEYKDVFEKLAKLRVNEKLRPTRLVNDDVLGFYGNFKKLEVD